MKDENEVYRRAAERLDPSERKVRFATPGELAAFCTAGKELSAPHLDIIDQAYVDIAVGDLRRVIITMPPRHGKTRRVSHWGPAWFLHRFPEKRVMLASYESEFAASHGRMVRDIIATNDLGISLSPSSSAAARWDLDGHAGGMVTAGMGGRLTGLGAHLLIIDDPIKDSAEAHSQTIRDAQWEWLLSTALTRLEPGGAVFILLTRWHEDDLAGRILRQEGHRWRHVNLTAIAEENDPLGRAPGEALWPERFPIEDLEEIRATQGEYWWNSQYMGRPTPLAGGIFKKAWFRYWERVGDNYRLGDRTVKPSDGWTFATVDLAVSTRTTADWTVVASWFVTYDGDLILLDLERKRIEETLHWPLVRSQHEKHGLDFVAVESRMFGTTLVYQAGRAGKPGIRELKADTDKITRAIPATVRMENGRLWLPQTHPLLDVLETELLGFPNATHDDCVDVVSYAVLQLAKYGHGRRPRTRELPKNADEVFWAEVAKKDRPTRRKFHHSAGWI